MGVGAGEVGPGISSPAGTGGSFGPLTGDVTTVGNAATLVATPNVESIISANPAVVANGVASALYLSSTQR